MKKKAFVLANQKYDNSNLYNTENDANCMGKILLKLGFEVHLHLNLTLNDTILRLEEFGKTLEDSNVSVALFYYSGHGFGFEGKNYILPIGAKIDTPSCINSQCMNLDDVIKLYERNKEKVNILFIDACRNNPFNYAFKSSLSPSGYSTPELSYGTIIGFATKQGTVAIDMSSMENSIYTHCLLKNIEIPNIPIEKVLKNVAREVLELTENKQFPSSQNELLCDFYFLKIESDEISNEIHNGRSINLAQHIPNNIKFQNYLNSSGKLEIRVQPTVFFDGLLAGTFPKTRGIEWFEGKKAIYRLEYLFRQPFYFDTCSGYGTYTDPIWWFREGDANKISEFSRISESKCLIDEMELCISKIAVFRSPHYYRSCIYVEVSPDIQSGVNLIEESDIYNHNDTYVDETYAIFNGKHITINEFDDGATVINDKIVQIDEAIIRRRFLTKYNFIISSKSSPYNSRAGNLLGKKYMNAILTGKKNFENFIEEAAKLPKSDLDD